MTAALLWLGLLGLPACEGGRSAEAPVSVDPAAEAAVDPYAEARALYAQRALLRQRAETGR